MILIDIHDAERVTQEKKKQVLRTQTIIKQHLRIRKTGIQGAPGQIVQFQLKYSYFGRQMAKDKRDSMFHVGKCS